MNSKRSDRKTVRSLLLDEKYVGYLQTSFVSWEIFKTFSRDRFHNKRPEKEETEENCRKFFGFVFSSYAPCVRIATTVVVWDKCWPLSKYLWIYSIVVPPPFSCQRCCCLDQSQTAILVQLFEKQRGGGIRIWVPN